MISLPWMGLGLGSNLSRSDVPQPYRLLDAHAGAFDYVEYSAPLGLYQARRVASMFDDMWSRRAATPVLFHPVHLNLWGPELESAAALVALDAHARAVGSPWVGNDVAWWHSAGEPFAGYFYVAPPMTRGALDQCVRHAAHVQSALSVPLLLENPTVIAARGEMHVLDFMAALHARTGLGLILDVGHLLSHQLSRGLPATAGLDGFPFDAVFEIHVAGGVIVRRDGRAFYADDHPQPIRDEVWSLLEAVLPRCRRLRALTYEGDGHPEWLAVRNLSRLRAMLAPTDDATIAIPRASTDASLDAWSTYDQAHGRASSADPVGDAMEVDWRAAVVAEQLDRVVPLTRALVAGDRASLAAFLASDELRAGYSVRGRSLLESFVAYAQARLPALDPAVTSVFAIETWLLGARRSSHGARPDAPIHLASSLALAVAPHDPSEVIHARAALDRHLVGRARAAGLYDASGLEGVLQAARRMPARPCPILVRRRAGSVELVPIDERTHAVLSAASAGLTHDALEELRREHPDQVQDATRRGWIVMRRA